MKQVCKVMCNAMIHKHRVAKILRGERLPPDRGFRKSLLKGVLFQQDCKEWVAFLEIAAAQNG